LTSNIGISYSVQYLIFFSFIFVRNFQSHVNELQKVEQLMELWIESFDAFCLSTTMLSEAFSSFHSRSPYSFSVSEGSASPYAGISQEFNKIMNTIQRQLQPLIHETFVDRSLKPVVGVLSLVPDLNEQLQQRKAQLMEFDTYKAKIQKEHAAGRDNTHPNVQRKNAKLDEAAKRLHELQTSIYQTFGEFERSRPQTLGPELASFVACCHTFGAAVHNSTSRILPLLPQVVSSLAALDYSTLATELKFETSPRFMKEKLKPAPAVYERTEAAGGKRGGYGLPHSLNTGDDSIPDTPRSDTASLLNGSDSDVVALSSKFKDRSLPPPPLLDSSTNSPVGIPFVNDPTNHITLGSQSPFSMVSPPPKPPKPPKQN
jgi:hypothetical protein